MTPAGRLEPQDWMTAPATRKVVAALSAQGSEVRFVGGCVRDALCGRPVSDIDLATPDPPETVIALLSRAGLKSVPTGLSHGTITAVSDHRPFEITTLRHDVESHGRHATVAFTDDWKTDAARRDFTFNAMSCRPDGTLFDPFGGQADLAAGRVRFVGAAQARIEEDYLRLLRFFRFHAHYGQGAPDAEGLAAASALAPQLARLSGERIRTELLKLLGAPAPIPVLRVMAERRILEAVLPELGDPGPLAALIDRVGERETPDRLLRLAALLPADGAAAGAVAAKLRLSNAETARIVAATEQWPHSKLAAQPSDLRRSIYRLGQAAVVDGQRLAWAAAEAAGRDFDRSQAREALALAESWRPPAFPLKGRDALAAGVTPGAMVGDLLKAVEDWWLAQDFVPDRAACLARLKQLIAAQAR